MKSWIFGAVFILGIFFLFVIIVSPVPRDSIKIVGKQNKVDERDTIFSRFDLVKGSKKFEDYYKRNPYYRKIDDEIRTYSDILSDHHKKREPILFSIADAEFAFLGTQLNNVDGKVSQTKKVLSPSENTRIVKNFLKYLGSDDCGICELNQAYVYSHVGRGPEPYGSEIHLKHKYAIVFIKEMDYEMIKYAPQSPVIVETSKRYVDVGTMSIRVAFVLRLLGYSARAHIAESNYQGILSPFAWEAGLGEIGRSGILINWKYGSRIRLGLVTTDLPLETDKKRSKGMLNFCEKCKKCVLNCPSRAIPEGEKKEDRGALKWSINREECYKFWRKIGTDCSLCIHVCPYSKPNNLFHNIIRFLTAYSSFFQTISVWGDSFFYGKYLKRIKYKSGELMLKKH
ncbi:MAG: 4Fe-4S dicluster domain-containing protein [Candidatus Aminicenantaceae bacterium]